MWIGTKNRSIKNGIDVVNIDVMKRNYNLGSSYLLTPFVRVLGVIPDEVVGLLFLQLRYSDDSLLQQKQMISSALRHTHRHHQPVCAPHHLSASESQPTSSRSAKTNEQQYKGPKAGIADVV